MVKAPVTPQIKIPKWAMPKTPTAPSMKKIGNLSSMSTTDLVQTRMNVVRSWEKDFTGLFSRISVDAAGKFGKEFQGAAKEFVKEFERGLYETIGKGVFEQFMKNLPKMQKLEIFDDTEEDEGPSYEEEQIIKSKWGRLMESLKEKFDTTFGDLKDQLAGDLNDIMGPEIRVIFTTLKNVLSKTFGGFKKIFGFFGGLLKNKKNKTSGKLGPGGMGEFSGGGGEGGGVIDTLTGGAAWELGKKGLGWGSKILKGAGRLAAGPIGLTAGAAALMWEMNSIAENWAGNNVKKRETLDYSSAEGAAAEAWSDALKDQTKEQIKAEKKNFDTYLGPSSEVSGFLEGIWSKITNFVSNTAGQMWNPKDNKPYGAENAIGQTHADAAKMAADNAIIDKAAAKYGVDPNLMKGLMYHESGGGKNVWNFQADAYLKKVGGYDKSLSEQEALVQEGIRKGAEWKPGQKLVSSAYGPGQMTGSTAKHLGFTAEDRLDPEKNVEMVAKYLADLLKRTGDNVPAALRSYTGGSGGEAHIKNIMSATEKYRSGALRMAEAPTVGAIQGGDLGKSVTNAISTAVANPTFGKNCGEQVTANLNAGLEAAGGKKLPGNYGVGIPNYLAKQYDVPLLSKEQITPEALRAMGPGTAIGFNRRPGDKNYRPEWNTHAEMTAINPATGQLEVASKSAGRGILWKKIDENYIKSLGYDARAANPFLSAQLGGTGAAPSPAGQIAGLEKQKGQAQADVTQQYLDQQKATLAATQNLPKAIEENRQQQPGVQPVVSQTNVIGGGKGGGQREQQDFFSFDDPFAAMMMMSLSVLNA